MKNKVSVYTLLDLDAPKNEQAILSGTIEDVRIFMKNRWKKAKDFVESVTKIEIEEDYYQLMDDDNELKRVIKEMDYSLAFVCDVPIEDFEE